MNVLVYDPAPRVAHLAASLARAGGHRAARAGDADEAESKLNCGLFDLLVVGPDGAPPRLAAFLQRELPRLPLVLAGAPAAVAPAGPILAVLPEPLSAVRFAAALRRADHLRRRRLAEVAVSVAAEGLSIACRLADLTPETLVLAGDSEPFRRHFGSPPPRVRASLLGVEIEGDVVSAGPPDLRHPARLDVRPEPSAARSLRTLLLRA